MSSWPDFDKLLELAKKDPEQLEQLRKNHVEAIIARAPEEFQRRLRGLQFQIDCTRRLHSNALGSCIEISRMMYDSLQRLNRAFNGAYEQKPEAIQSAQIVNFPIAG